MGRLLRAASCLVASTSSTSRTWMPRWTGPPAAPARGAVARWWYGRSPSSVVEMTEAASWFAGGAPPVSAEAVFREERGRLLAALVRRFGDLDLAEEAASEAIEAALAYWSVDGVPPKPGAWPMTTARRKAVDLLRRDRAYAARLALLQVEVDRAGPAAA